jgi:hypothetical protein
VCALLALAACSEPPPSRELPLEPAGDQGSVYGALRLTPSPRGHAGFTVSMTGLSPGATYVLCLNAQEPGSPSSETLGNLGIPGWPLGAFYPSPHGGFEGFWDFEKVQADAQGSYQKHFELPLPALAYRVQFLVKTNHDVGARPILKSQPLLLDVRDPLKVDLLTGTIAALAAIPLAFMARGRGRRRVHEHADELPRHDAYGSDADGAPPLASVEVPLRADAGCAQTLVERARAEGVLQHHKNYAWIEIHGRRKSFRARQALVFRILCEQDPNCDGIPQDEIIKAWEEVFRANRANPVRVRDIFRSCEHEPGDFIVRVAGPASVYRLRLEPTPPPPSADPDSDAESSADGSLHDEG